METQHLRASLYSQASWPSPSGTQGRARLRLRAGDGWLRSPTCAHSEVKLSVVTYLTNSIVDEILQELYHSHKSLVSLLDAGQAQACPVLYFTPSPPALSPPSRSWEVGSFLGILFTAVLPQARHLAQLRTLSDPPGGLGQGQDLTSRGRGRNHDHEETTDDELGTNIVSIPTTNPLPNLSPAPELGKHCPFHFSGLYSPLAGPGLIPQPQPAQPLPFAQCPNHLRRRRL